MLRPSTSDDVPILPATSLYNRCVFARGCPQGLPPAVQVVCSQNKDQVKEEREDQSPCSVEFVLLRVRFDESGFQRTITGRCFQGGLAVKIDWDPLKQ